MANFRMRNGRWYYTIDERTNDGRRIRHEHFGGLTKSECAKAYRKAMIEIDRTGKFFELSGMNLGEFLQEWFRKEIEKNLRQNTQDVYSALIKNHISYDLGTIKLKEITTPLLQDYLSKLKDDGYAKSTVKSIHIILKSSLRWAVANRRYLLFNPMDNVKVPRYDVAPSSPGIFTNEEIEAIFEKYPAGNKLFIPLRIAYQTGLRRGEILSLRWPLIDLQRKIIHVTGTLYDKTGFFVQDNPKTSSSIRNVPFGQSLFLDLKKQQIEQKKNRLKYGQFYYYDSDFVCTNENGKPLTSNALRGFEQFCKKTFGHGSMHTFRHTHATKLLENGIDLDYVSKRLGHSSITTTADIYISMTDKRDKAAVELIDKVL
ncbi:tyrosine-type recombinase/integrase [Dialister invisus]|uniref:tyrosine-type recombinase/integrase n=1 Tax=Dialister invisus TaxID=218538 RepID=UPI003994400B